MSYSSTQAGWTTTTTNTYSYKAKSTTSKGAATVLANAFYNSSVDTLIHLFKQYGMDLLLPHQFIDTQEKANYYDAFEVQHDKGNSFLKNLGKGDHEFVYNYPEGYKPFDVVYEP